jgi:acyl-CoA thioester hydrolase
VVVEASIHYKRAAVFDDELNLATTLAETRRASLRFEYVLKRGEEVVCTGYTRHGCLDLKTGRPSRIPSGISATAR